MLLCKEYLTLVKKIVSCYFLL